MLFAAGCERATNTRSWMFYLLSQNPKERDKLLTDLHGVLPTSRSALAIPTL